MLGVEAETVPAAAFAEPGKVAGIRFELGDSFIQFVSGIGEDAPLSRVTGKRGEGLSQITLWVDDVDEEVALFRDAGVVFGDGEPKDLPFGRVAFGHPKTLNGIVWELEEHPEDEDAEG